MRNSDKQLIEDFLTTDDVDGLVGREGHHLEVERLEDGWIRGTMDDPLLVFNYKKSGSNDRNAVVGRRLDDGNSKEIQYRVYPGWLDELKYLDSVIIELENWVDTSGKLYDRDLKHSVRPKMTGKGVDGEL